MLISTLNSLFLYIKLSIPNLQINFLQTKKQHNDTHTITPLFHVTNKVYSNQDEDLRARFRCFGSSRRNPAEANECSFKRNSKACKKLKVCEWDKKAKVCASTAPVGGDDTCDAVKQVGSDVNEVGSDIKDLTQIVIDYFEKDLAEAKKVGVEAEERAKEAEERAKEAEERAKEAEEALENSKGTDKFEWAERGSKLLFDVYVKDSLIDYDGKLRIGYGDEYEVKRNRPKGDFGTEDDFIAICAALKHAPKLKGISVSNDFHFGDDGALALARALTHLPKLTELSIEHPGETEYEDGNNVGVTAMSAIGFNAILDSLKKTALGLQKLNVEYHDIGDDGLAALTEHLKDGGFMLLEELHISNNELSKDAMVAFAQTLLDNPHPSLKKVMIHKWMQANEYESSYNRYYNDYSYEYEGFFSAKERKIFEKTGIRFQFNEMDDYYE